MVAVGWLAFLLRIPEFLVYNIGPDTKYLAQGLSCFVPPLQENNGIIP
jgi:hypothetical protein